MDRTLRALGGPLHGGTVDLPEGRMSYVDLTSGSCYVARELIQPLPDGSKLAREVAIHESVIGDDQSTQMALFDAVLLAFFREGRVIDSAPPAPVVATAGAPGGRTTGSGLVLP